MNPVVNIVGVEPAHSKFGASVARRVMRCTASVGLIEKVPAYLRKPPSGDAERGTGCHAATVDLINGTETLASLVGKTFGSYTLTRDDVENAIAPVFGYVDRLLDTPGAEFYVEHRVVFPTIPGAYGTADLLVRVGNTIHVIDYKFGSGVRVTAVYPDGDEDVLNAQPTFYACGARATLREFFTGVETVVITILQPMSIEPDAEMVSSVTVTHDELDKFITVYRAACEEALSESPRLARGDWCRFCPAKPVCPAHTAPLLDLAQLLALMPSEPGGRLAGPSSKDAYLQLLADGLNLLDATRDIRTAFHDQAKAALESGDVVPGYALTAGRAQRHWRDDQSATIAALEGLGLARSDVVAEELRSPKQVEIRAKARGLKIPQELIVSHHSGTSLVRCENAHAPVPARSEIVRSFSAALEAFRKEESNGRP
jgi:hypothetical protein